ncbi:MAG: hypothetical protein VB086_08545 [Clostridiaceae bacterium]|nr:hypothetical protein [Clostridiaceae bacterium]
MGKTIKKALEHLGGEAPLTAHLIYSSKKAPEFDRNLVAYQKYQSNAKASAEITAEILIGHAEMRTFIAYS